MLNKLTAALLLAGVTLLACSAPPQPTLGGPAPAIEASTWFNHEGEDPNLQNLKGKALLLEFWATW